MKRLALAVLAVAFALTNTVDAGPVVLESPPADDGLLISGSVMDASSTVRGSTIPSGLRFFQSFDRLVQVDPSLERGRAMIENLKTVDIERGKPLKPIVRRECR